MVLHRAEVGVHFHSPCASVLRSSVTHNGRLYVTSGGAVLHDSSEKFSENISEDSDQINMIFELLVGIHGVTSHALCCERSRVALSLGKQKIFSMCRIGQYGHPIRIPPQKVRGKPPTRAVFEGLISWLI